MIVKTVRDKDIPTIVKIHVSAFNDFFLTSLGERFLEVYYSTFLKHEDGIILGCYDDNDELVGFGAASKDAYKFNSRLVKSNLNAYVILGCKLLLFNFGSLLRLLKNFTKQSNDTDTGDDYAELYSIGVRLDVQGQGIGKLILAEIESICSQKKQQISLTTDYFNNESTISFYKKCGYEVLSDFIAYPNRRMYRFIKRLTQ